MSKRRGFTLIELLVVIGIIGLLVGLVMPALSKARQSSKRVACGSNLSQIGVAMQSYLGEHNDRYPKVSLLPSADPFPDDTGEAIYISEVLLRYAGNQKNVFKCPSDRPNPEREAPNANRTYFETERSSYEFQTRLGGHTINEAARFIKTHLGAQVATNTIRIMNDYGNFHGESGVEQARCYLFADGHVSDFEEF